MAAARRSASASEAYRTKRSGRAVALANAAPGFSTHKRPLSAADDQDVEILVRGEIAGGHADRAGREGLDVRGAEADQPLSLAGIDDELEILDRTRPVRAGLQNIADPPLLQLRGVAFGVAGELVDVREERRRYAV